MKTPASGDIFGPYRLLEPLGSGGMAVVFRAEGPDGLVALKILQPGRITTEERKRFQREFLTLRRMEHPNIIRAYATGVEGNTPYLALQLIEGFDLGTLLERWQNAPPENHFIKIEAIFRSLCEALAHIHDRGIVHRDLKPGNILISRRDYTPYITDFGAIKANDHFTTSLTVVGRLVGTVAFMAPEQITGEAVDARADLYSLGAVLYNMLTGRRPIIADSIAGYLARHLSESPKPASELVHDVPRTLDRICTRLLEKDPNRRFSSARQILSALSSPQATLPPIYGRRSEQEVLAKAINEVQAGIGAVILIEGAEGVGKSRLLDEVRSMATEKNLGWSQIYGSAPDEIQRIEAELQKGTPWILLVDELVPGSPTDAMLAIFCGEMLSRMGGPLLVVAATTRPGSYLGALDAPTPVQLELAGLDRDALRAILRDRGLSGGVGALLARRFAEELHGRPGPALEQLTTLISAGWLSESDGMLRVVRPVDGFRSDALPLPERVRAEGVARLKALPPLQRASLSVLSILRGSASVMVIVPLVGVAEGLPELARPDATKVEAAIRGLVNHRLVRSLGEGLNEEFSVIDARQRQLVAEALSPEVRTRLHKAAADVFAQFYRRRPAMVAEVVGYHLAQAGDIVGALPLYVEAASRALKRGELSDCRVLCQRANELRLLAEPQLKALEAARLRRVLYQTLGEALRGSDRLDSAEDAFVQALLAARVEGDRVAQGRALAGRGLVAAGRGRFTEAIGSLEEAVANLDRGEKFWEESVYTLGLLRLQLRNLEGASQIFELLLDRPGADLQALHGQLLIGLAQGRDLVWKKTVDLPDPGDPRAGDAWVSLLRLRGEWGLLRGEFEEVLRICDRLEEVGDRLSLVGAGPVAAALRLGVLVGRGNIGTATRMARDLVGSLRVGKCRIAGVWAWVVRVLVLTEDVWDLENQFHETLWPLDLPFDAEAQRLALLALSGRAQGDAWEAASLVLVRPPALIGVGAARVEIDAARALVRLHDRDSAIRLLERALARLTPPQHASLIAEARGLMTLIAPTRTFD